MLSQLSYAPQNVAVSVAGESLAVKQKTKCCAVEAKKIPAQPD
jgi:hypothetical protein